MHSLPTNMTHSLRSCKNHHSSASARIPNSKDKHLSPFKELLSGFQYHIFMIFHLFYLQGMAAVSDAGPPGSGFRGMSCPRRTTFTSTYGSATQTNTHAEMQKPMNACESKRWGIPKGWFTVRMRSPHAVVLHTNTPQNLW